MRRWQAEWDVSEKGRNVYKWCGKVGRDLIPLSHKAAQFITGHGNFGSYLYRFKLGGRLSGECECGAGEEDVEYIRRVCKSQDRSRGRNIFGTEIFQIRGFKSVIEGKAEILNRWAAEMITDVTWPV